MAQKASDTVSGSGNDAGKEGQSILDKAKDTLGMSTTTPPRRTMSEQCD